MAAGRRSLAVALLLCVALGSSRLIEARDNPPVAASQATQDLPLLTQPVNDFAHVIDRDSATGIDRMIRALQAASGDVVVVATVPTIEPYADIREYAVKLFENHGRGIGTKGKDNGLLIVLALKERSVRIEVGYDLEQWITDGYAGETSREFMLPLFRQGQYGPGLVAGAQRVIGRIAQARGVSLEGVQVPRAEARRAPESSLPIWVVIAIFVVFWLLSRAGGGGPRSRYWGGGPWSGWSSGVGPFGGGWSSGGGGFGGGFGGFGGGSSGGGGGGASW
jgi:uncharacterized protein